MLRVIIAPALLCAVATAAAAQSRSTQDTRIDTTYAFDPRGSVSLTIGDGEVIVTAWNRDEIRIRARVERNQVRMDATSSRLSLELARPRSGDAHFEVTVPAGARVTARATQGDVSVTGARGGVDVNTQSGDVVVIDGGDVVDITTFSGDVALRNLTGRVDVRTTNGTVTIENSRGDVEAASVSGDIELRRVVARYVRGRTTSGDITFDGDVDSTGRYELGTHSGSVYLGIPATAGAQVTVATYNGTVESDFPIILRPGEHSIGASRRFTFTIGKGDARISAESFSGDITIRSTGRRP